MPVQVILPDERAEQLKRFARSKNVPVAEAIGFLIDDAIDAGKIVNELPGFDIKRDGERVVVDTGAWTRSFTRDMAAAYAGQIRAVTKSALTPSPSNLFLSEMPVSAMRRGAGVKLVDKEAIAEKIVSRGVADDVARRIEKAAE